MGEKGGTSGESFLEIKIGSISACHKGKWLTLFKEKLETAKQARDSFTRRRPIISSPASLLLPPE
jgi:hypothetical protein